MASGFRKTNLTHEKSIIINGTIFSRNIYVWKSIVFISMVPPCHKIRKKHPCYLNLGKQNRFYDLFSCDLILNNCIPCNHTSVTLNRFFFAKEKTDANIFNIFLHWTCYVTEI